ncbi:MAG: penicillin acylase family protein [Myxococcota bacterium]
MTRLGAARPCLSTLFALALTVGGSACFDPNGGAMTGEDGSSTGGAGDPSGDTSASTESEDPTADDGTVGDELPAGVRVLRDAHGVPHIVAQTDPGAMYGLGWASAEDRLVPMTLTVLAAQGRLAEHFGPEHVDADLRMRLMGTWRHALGMADALDEEHRGLLDAYAQGVNDWVQAHPDALESLWPDLGIAPQTWTAAHSLAVWIRVSDLFTNDPFGKATALEQFEILVGQVGLPAAIEQTVGTPAPGQPEAAVVQADDVPAAVQQAIHDYADAMGYGDPAMGGMSVGFAATAPHHYGHVTPKFSHAWVVSGARTTTGEAALVSDPQVTVFSPNFLYEFAVVGDRIHARGAGAAGMPGLLIGQTQDVAWGMTAAGLDQRDLFRLEMTDATHYRVDGQEHALEVDTEVMMVAGAGEREVEFRQSLWGPVITDLLPPGVEGEYALKGLPFAVSDRDPFVAMVGMMRATDLDGLRAALVDWTTPSANFVAAGPGGQIFYTLIGDIPLRSPQSPLGGMIAQDGRSAAYDWVDLVPNEHKPWVLDPAAGYLLSANHRPVADWYPLPLGVGQGGGGDTLRSRRLRELLEALPAVTEPTAVLDDVQWDCVNAGRRDLVALAAHVRALQPGRLSPETIATLDALDPWRMAGGSMHTEQAGVFLADRISVKFRIQQTGPALNAQFGGGQTGLDLFLDTMMAAVAADPGFMPDNATVTYLDAVLSQAWQDASHQVPDPSQWDPHYAATVASPSLPYLVGADLSTSPVDLVIDAPTLACADGNTVWSQRGETFTQFVDLADPDGSRTVLPPGNSGDPDAAAHTSQLDAWAHGQLKPTALSVDGIETLAVSFEVLDWSGQ